MNVLVLGAYGHFGKVICRKLKDIAGVVVIGGGRRKQKLESLANELEVKTLHVDWRDKELTRILTDNKIHLLIHVAGPFVGQDCSVAEACIEAGCYYVDMADDPDFVQGVTALDEKAKAANVMLLSGMGMLSLHDAILTELQKIIPEMTHCEIGFSSSSRMPGLASIQSIMSSCGRPVEQLEAGRQVFFTGLAGRGMHNFLKGFARRDLVNLKTIDMGITPAKYGFTSLHCRAGHGQAGHGLISMLAYLSYTRWLNPVSLAGKMMCLSKLKERFGSDKGGLFIEVEGMRDSKLVEARAELQAIAHQTDLFPVAGILALCHKLMNDFLPDTGAYNGARGLVSLAEMMKVFPSEEVKLFMRNTPL